MNTLNTPCWEDVLQCLNKYHSCATKSKPVYKENHVFDEDKSVKWNKEEVIRQNEAIKADNEALRTKKSELWRETVELATKTIIYVFKQANTTISKTGAKRLFNRLYCVYDGEIDEIEDIISIFTDALSEYDV